MLKTTVSGSSAGKLVIICEGSTFKRVDDGGNNKIGVANIKSFSQSIIAKSKNIIQSKKPERKFLIPRAKLALIELRKTLIKTSIPYHFDLECHI